MNVKCDGKPKQLQEIRRLKESKVKTRKGERERDGK